MNDPDPPLRRVMVLIAVVLAALVMSAPVAGARAAQFILAAALMALCVIVYREVAKSAFPAAPAPISTAASAAVVWRSERWVRQAAQRGIASLECWRREQPPP